MEIESIEDQKEVYEFKEDFSKNEFIEQQDAEIKRFATEHRKLS